MSRAKPGLEGLLLPFEVCALLCDVFPGAANFDAAMSVIGHVRQAMLGDGLLTVNRVSRLATNTGGFELQRMWSSNSQAYPVAGRKRKTLTPWSRQLILEGEVFVGEGDRALAEVFDDHVRIIELGLHGVVNVPVIIDGQCAATLNVLGCYARWQPNDITLIRLLAVLATPWILRAIKE